MNANVNLDMAKAARERIMEEAEGMAVNEKTKHGLRVLEAALLLGVLSDALLRVESWGLNVFLWTGAVVAAMFAVARMKNRRLSREWHLFAAGAIIFAAFFVWRASIVLRSLDVLVMLMMLALAAYQGRNNRMRFAGIFEYCRGMVTAGFNSWFGAFPLLLSDIKWKSLPRSRRSRHVWAVLRGAIIAVPLLLIFGALFMAADAVFNNLIARSFNFDIGNLFSHVLFAGFMFWLACGFLRGSVAEGTRTKFNNPFSPTLSVLEKRSAEAGDEPAPPAKLLSLGIVETCIVLGSVNLLFLLFVLVQLRYFFGGADVVLSTTGLSYAEYARGGFFELVWATWLVLPLLLVAHWLLRKENPAHERIFRFLAGAQIALLFVIIWSAVSRMRLYQSEYGLTELRLYTTAFMGWLSLVFVWFALTVLRGRRERFAFGALVAGCFVIVMLHAINPDALIARTNAARAARGDRNGFDAAYAASLSYDAVPELLKALPEMTENNRRVVANRLLERQSELNSSDLRTWNLGRARARSVLREHESGLRQIVSIPPAPAGETLGMNERVP